MGDSRKYPYHTTDSFHILTPPAFGISKMRYPPVPSDFHNRKPPPVRIFHFFVNPLELPAGFANMPNLAYFTENYFKWLYFCSVQLVIEGVIMTLEILEWKLTKINKKFSPHCSIDATYINFTFPQTGTEH